MSHDKSKKNDDRTVDTERAMMVRKRDDLIQKGRHQLSLQEQKCVLYAISKIRPTDDVFKEYIFDIKDFYKLCGIEDQSYTRLKQTLKGLSDRSWWATIDDKGTESVLRWFTTVRSNKKSGKVILKFHEDMMPFLLHLTGDDHYFTKYSLQYVLPMNGQYAPRLYEILKSYQKNNRRWFFEIEAFKKLMDAEDYVRWPDFRRRVLEPAVAEINKYTDIKIAWRAITAGKKVVKVDFFMDGKTNVEIAHTQREIRTELEGQLDIFDLMNEDDPFKDFIRERKAAHQKEYDEQMEKDAAIQESKANIRKWLED